MSRYYDIHCHLHEMTDREIDRILELEKDITIVAVSDDLDSLHRTLELSSLYSGRIVPCAGFHPWNIGKKSTADADEVIRAAYRLDLSCIGEVGLDLKFVPETYEVQEALFRRFLELARDIDAMVNVHAPGAWRQALEMIMDVGVRRGLIHWYTGPISLLDTISSAGLYISVNPAVTIQKKHQAVVSAAPLEIIVVESDSPYNYRGLKLNPLMVKRSIEEISLIKGLRVEEVADTVRLNSERLLGV